MKRGVRGGFDVVCGDWKMGTQAIAIRGVRQVLLGAWLSLPERPSGVVVEKWTFLPGEALWS